MFITDAVPDLTLEQFFEGLTVKSVSIKIDTGEEDVKRMCIAAIKTWSELIFNRSNLAFFPSDREIKACYVLNAFEVMLLICDIFSIIYFDTYCLKSESVNGFDQDSLDHHGLIAEEWIVGRDISSILHRAFDEWWHPVLLHLTFHGKDTAIAYLQLHEQPYQRRRSLRILFPEIKTLKFTPSGDLSPAIIIHDYNHSICASRKIPETAENVLTVDLIEKIARARPVSLKLSQFFLPALSWDNTSK